MSILLALLRSPGPRNRARRGDLRPNNLDVELTERTESNAYELKALSGRSRSGGIYFSAPESPSEVTTPITSGGGQQGRPSEQSLLKTEETFALQCLVPNVPPHETLERLLDACWSGVWLCKLLISAIPGSLDVRAFNHGLGLTAEDVLENFQLCYNCAQAQGCDVQGFTVQQLRSCEISAVTDFVLEVMRVSATQELPATDRHWLVPSAPLHPPGGRHSVAATRQRPDAAASGAAPGGVRRISGDGSSRGASSSSSSSSSSGGGAEPTSAVGAAAGGAGRAPGGIRTSAPTCHIAPPASAGATFGPGAAGHATSINYKPRPGTAAARRAAAGLEEWALQLVAGGTAAAAQLAVAGGAGERGAACVAPGSGSPPSPSHAGSVDGVEPDSDPLGTAVWERLAERLPFQPCSSGDGNGREAAAAGESGLAGDGPCGAPQQLTGATLQEPLQGPGSVPAAVPTAPLASAPDGGGGVVCGGSGPGDEPTGSAERHATSALTASPASLSRLLAPAQGVALPQLLPEHLRCRHAGLRAVLLAHALLAHARARDAAAAAATAAVGAVGASESGAVSDATVSGGGASEEGRGQEEEGGRGAGRSSGDSSPDGLSSRQFSLDSAAAAVVAAAKPPPASPAPPLPRQVRQALPSGRGRQGRHDAGAGGAWLHGVPERSDTLSEHNMLVQREHQQREMRRQQQGAASGGAAGAAAGKAGGVAAAAGFSVVLFGGDADDVVGEQEERVLRLWLNSLDPRLHVGSLFEAEVATGWPLLMALDAIQPGCVPWHSANRPPFKEKVHKLLSIENCNLVIAVCEWRLAMPPLVNIGGPDLALGQRRQTLSLVFQMMRHHTSMLLGLVAPPPSAPSPLPQRHRHPLAAQHEDDATAASPFASTSTAHVLFAPPPPSPHRRFVPLQEQHSAQLQGAFSQLQMQSHGFGGHAAGAALRRCGTFGGSAGSSGGAASQSQGQPQPHQPHHHRPHTPHVEVEKAVLAWANAKLTAAAAAAPPPPDAGATGAAANPDSAGAAASSVRPVAPFKELTSFSDPRLGEGRLLLQLLAAVCPRAVNPAYVLEGKRREERESNAKYLLSCARKVGCVIFLAWEDVVAARPSLLLLLVAALMVLDRKREAAAAAAAPATAAAAAGVAADASAATAAAAAEAAPAEVAGLRAGAA